MATISIRLQDDILTEINDRAQALHIPRAEYVRRAIAAMNEQVTKKMRRKRIIEASKRVRGESIKINAEFAAIEDALDV